VEVDLAGSGDTAVVSGHATAACRSGSGSRPAGGRPGSFFTDELACSVDRARAAEGLCSATPCEGGLFFAFRTLHRPDGGTEPAGSTCVSLDRARAGPALTAADVFAAIRRVKLPPGTIRIAPSGRGLANLPTRLWLTDDVQPPVDLDLAGSVVHADFAPVSYRWTAGREDAASERTDVYRPDGPGPRASGGSTRTVAASPEPSGQDGASAMVFRRHGEFVVSVVTTWSAAAYLDGRYVGEVGGLTSTARVAYPVAELRTSLSG
jgi:hypothetical protein